MEINDSYELRLRSKLADVVVGFCHNKPHPHSLKCSSYGLRILLQRQLCHHHHFVSSYTIWILKFNFPNILISFSIDTISYLVRRVARSFHGSEFRSHCAVSRNVCALGYFHVASLSPSSPSTIIASNNTERLWCENIYIISMCGIILFNYSSYVAIFSFSQTFYCSMKLMSSRLSAKVYFRAEKSFVLWR